MASVRSLVGCDTLFALKTLDGLCAFHICSVMVPSNPASIGAIIVWPAIGGHMQYRCLPIILYLCSCTASKLDVYIYFLEDASESLKSKEPKLRWAYRRSHARKVRG